MSDHTNIEWTDATWNPITGCSVVSAGCKHCYAMRLAGTRLRHHPSRAGLTRETSAGPVWTGKVRLNEAWLDQPVRWKKPRRIFVCAHGDLFHPAVPVEWIDQVFAVMALAPQHTFQVLTKRPGRMRNYLTDHAAGGRHIWVAAQALKMPRGTKPAPGWPIPNVWLGVSVEDQATADERIPLLLDTPAAVRWISAEPLLDPLDLSNIPWPASHVSFPDSDDITALRPALVELEGTRIDWVVAGGESGPDARPSHPDWFRSLRDQCQLASKRSGVGVPFFFKQWGDWAPNCLCDSAHAHPTTPRPSPGKPGVMFRCGKRNAGRLLDGREWNEYPVTDP